MVYLHVGTKDDVINVEEQFLDGIYNPDFIDDSSDSNDEDGSVSLDNGNQRVGVSGNSKPDEPKPIKRKRNDSGEVLVIDIKNLFLIR